MAKKKKKFRLKPHQKAQLLAELQTEAESPAEPKIVLDQLTATRASAASQPKSLPVEDQSIKPDLARIVWAVGLLMGLVVIASVIDQKVHFSLALGQKVASVLGLGD